MDLARELLQATMGEQRAAEMIERLSQSFVELPFSFMQHLDARQIVSFLSDEHPQTIALVLAHLPAGLASHILAGLGRELQADVAHRIAVMDPTSPDLIRKVESSLERRPQLARRRVRIWPPSAAFARSSRSSTAPTAAPSG